MSIHSGHRARVRKKFFGGGAESFADHELLELLLFYSIPRGDVNPVAHRLIDTFGSFSGVLDAPYEELLKINGIGETTAQLIKLVPTLSRRYTRSASGMPKMLITTEDAGRFVMPHFANRSCESLFIVCMDRKHKILYSGELGIGGMSSVEVMYRDIMEVTLRHESVKVVLAHNHPSGVALPSELDYVSTTGMYDMLKEVGILLLDHLVVAGDDFVSMAENGDLPGLEKDYEQELRTQDPEKEKAGR